MDRYPSDQALLERPAPRPPVRPVFIPTLSWKGMALNAAAAFAFGLAALAVPRLTVEVLVMLFGAFAFVYGAIRLGLGLTLPTSGQSPHWAAMVLGGVLSLIIGTVALITPEATAIALVYLVAAWAVATGAFELLAAFRLRSGADGRPLLAMAGVLSLILGGLLIAVPQIGLLALIWCVGLYALLLSGLYSALALHLRRSERQPATG